MPCEAIIREAPSKKWKQIQRPTFRKYTQRPWNTPPPTGNPIAEEIDFKSLLSMDEIKKRAVYQYEC